MRTVGGGVVHAKGLPARLGSTVTVIGEMLELMMRRVRTTASPMPMSPNWSLSGR